MSFLFPHQKTLKLSFPTDGAVAHRSQKGGKAYKSKSWRLLERKDSLSPDSCLEESRLDDLCGEGSPQPHMQSSEWSAHSYSKPLETAITFPTVSYRQTDSPFFTSIVQTTLTPPKSPFSWLPQQQTLFSTTPHLSSKSTLGVDFFCHPRGSKPSAGLASQVQSFGTGLRRWKPKHFAQMTAVRDHT